MDTLFKSDIPLFKSDVPICPPIKTFILIEKLIK